MLVTCTSHSCLVNVLKKLQGLFFPLGNKKIVHSYNNLLTKTDLISFKFFMDDLQYVADHGHSKWNEVDSRLREMLSLVDDWRSADLGNLFQF